jgi:hypothetical protein
MNESALILGKQLEAARQEIATLRTLTNYTVAIIAAAGGRVFVPADMYDKWSKRQWRHESDSLGHLFEALDEDKP